MSSFPPASAPSVATLVLALLLVVTSSVASAAQEAPADTLVGRVMLADRPIGGAPVVLHRVTSETSGELATGVTDASGTFRLPLEQVPTAAFNVFFVTAEYLGVRYFGQPVHLDEPRDGYAVAVYDTTSTLTEPVRIARRDVVMLPQANDSWEVNEIVSIVNPGSRALVAGSGEPTLEIRIPEDAADFQAGEGDILPHEVSLMDDRVLLLTPVTPGRRDLYIRYRLPAQPSAATVPLDLPTDTFNLFVQQPSHLTRVEGLGTTQMIDVEGQQFLQYGSTDLVNGGEIRLGWTGGPPVNPVLAAVAVTLVLLAAGAFAAARNRSVDSLG